MGRLVRLSLIGALTVTMLVVVAGAGAASTIFITNGDSAHLQAIDTTNGNILYTATTHTIGYPIAVRDTIWIGERDNTGEAREYRLADGSFAGGTAALLGPDLGNFVDGAVNGNINYTLDAFFNAPHTVYQANANWTNPMSLFEVPGTDVVGITYDTVNTNLWISDRNSIYQYTLAGNLLSQFPHQGQRGSLAYESATDTLWYVPNNPTAPLLQYSKAGLLLQSLNTPVRSGNVWGAEFQAQAPEPASLALFGAGLIGLARRTFRRRRQA